MAELRLESVVKRFGAMTAVDHIDLTVPEGCFVCLLGPSGCGKTTLLRMIAGLEAPSDGRLHLDGEDITDLPVHKRDFGMVFQSLALFPHLSVAENVAYALAVRGSDKAAQRARVAELLELIQLPDIAARQVAQLSGGQRQRVAIARALAVDPRLFLLDEPLSALDAKLREALQVELRLLQRRLGITTILVTHDQREAMTMADTIVVMEQGRVQQAGSPLEIYRNPANAFVADFIGTSNLLEGRARGGGRIELPGGEVAVSGGPESGAVTASIRPEDLRLGAADAAGANRLPGEVIFVRDVGQTVETHIDCAGQRLVAVDIPEGDPLFASGDRVTVELPAEAIVVFAA
ncbi:ABC transporter ATP-binding protein [Algihabitans albus]|uniref:ABC transporter ATP-binding protein n=1 Tax=Algihabitans albus TaxID=2164067 RepID=UPI000E5D4AA8|nr:ABC transporter ATP-binding protein [Algihabitans albus]